MPPQSSLQSNHNLNFIGDPYQPLWADKTRTVIDKSKKEMEFLQVSLLKISGKKIFDIAISPEAQRELSDIYEYIFCGLPTPQIVAGQLQH